MKTVSSRKKIKILISIVIIIIIVTACYGVFAANAKIWPFAQPTAQTDNTDAQSSETENTPEEAEETDTSPEPSLPQTNNDPVHDPIDAPPQNASYPIETPHYRIDQSSNNSFTVTLYAILNNPNQYEAYSSQLKQYKNEATSYLDQRHGKSNYTVTWKPSDAENI